MILKDVACEVVDCIHLAQDSCEVSNEPSFSIKDGEFL
jgi:hypothetical protein